MSESVEFIHSAVHQILRSVMGDKRADRVLNPVGSEEEERDLALYFRRLDNRPKEREAPEV